MKLFIEGKESTHHHSNFKLTRIPSFHNGNNSLYNTYINSIANTYDCSTIAPFFDININSSLKRPVPTAIYMSPGQTKKVGQSNKMFSNFVFKYLCVVFVFINSFLSIDRDIHVYTIL